MKNLLISSSIILGLATFPALANNSKTAGPYAEIAYETFSESNEDFADIDLTFTSLLLGYQVTSSTSVEAFYGQGSGSDDVGFMGVSVDVSMGSIYGVALKTTYDLSENVNAYAKLKYADLEIEAEAMGFGADESDSDLGLSIGLEFGSNDGFYATSSFTLWGMESETTQSGFKIGVGYNF